MSNPSGFASKLLVVFCALAIGGSFVFISGCEKGDTAVKVPEKKKKKKMPKGWKRGNTIGPAGAEPADLPEQEDRNASSEPKIVDSNPDPAPARTMTSSSASNMESGMANGLFPQMSLSFSQRGFGGGLAPDFQNPVSTTAADTDIEQDDRRGRRGSIGPAGGRDQVAGGRDDRGRRRSIGPAGGRSNSNDDIDAADYPEGLMGNAAVAFEKGNEDAAFKYLYAHILSDDEAAGKYGLRWYSGLTQPKVAMRIGVAVNYSPPRTFEGKPPVIGDPEDVKLPGATASRSGGRSGGRNRRSGNSIGAGAGGGFARATGTENSPYDNVDTERPEGFLMYYTGDFGDRLLNRLDARRTHDDAFYGEVLRDIADSMASPSGSRLDRANGRSAAADPKADVSGSLGPGVMLLGRGKKDAMVERGREMGLDVLMLFNVRVSSGRSPSGSASLKVYNLHSDKAEEVCSSRSLKSDTVAKKRESGVGEKSDPVEVALDGVFKETFDKKFRAAEMPAKLQPKHVLSRLKQVLAKSDADPLSTAVEIVGYHRLELLDGDAAMKALDEVLGDGLGNTILTGSTDDRLDALEKFLPAIEEVESSDGGNGGGNDFR